MNVWGKFHDVQIFPSKDYTVVFICERFLDQC